MTVVNKNSADIENEIAEFDKTIYRLKNLKDKAMIQKRIHDLNMQLNKIEGQIAITNEGDITDLIGEKIKISDEIDILEEESSEIKFFNKRVCFANIRELLKKNPDIKIGQIEKEAGLGVGYMSRLEKDDNTALPSIEFVVAAANMLNVSVDALISCDLSEISPTELFMKDFINNLITATNKDKLYWNRTRNENIKDLIISDYLPNYLIFEKHSEGFHFGEDGEEHEFYKVWFESNTYGSNTFFMGDYYFADLNPDMKIYLLGVGDSSADITDIDTVLELWGYSPLNGKEYLGSNAKNNVLKPLIEELYRILKDRDNSPQIRKPFLNSMEQFMKSLSDDANYVENVEDENY